MPLQEIARRRAEGVLITAAGIAAAEETMEWAMRGGVERARQLMALEVSERAGELYDRSDGRQGYRNVPAADLDSRQERHGRRVPGSDKPIGHLLTPQRSPKGGIVMSEAAGIPDAARQRLQKSPRTSDLSVDELALLQTLAIEPLGLVFGSSIYHVGWQRARLFENQELPLLSQAMHTARSRALERLEAEAAELDADGVIGVRLVIQQYAWGPDLLEFMAAGTAIRARGERLRPTHGRPFASNLSGQDFWKLRRYGYRPAGLAFGCCVYHVAHLGLSKWVQQVGRNAEMEAFTQATYSARELAMERMGAEAREAGGELVVAVALTEGSWTWDTNVIEFAAVGTAVLRDAQPPELPMPQLVVGIQSSLGATANLGRFPTPPATGPGRG